jgi:predicted alpha/beta superfamily hydrolase
MHKIVLTIFCLLVCNAGYSQHVVRTSSGTITRLGDFPSKLVDPRNIDVWLPDGYDPKNKYAVLYMHDGQMLYDSTGNWNHQEWGVDETAGLLIETHKTRPFIVVGIWNNGKFRHSEYFPQKVIQYIPEDQRKDLITLLTGGPMADRYLQFIVTERLCCMARLPRHGYRRDF